MMLNLNLTFLTAQRNNIFSDISSSKLFHTKYLHNVIFRYMTHVISGCIE